MKFSNRLICLAALFSSFILCVPAQALSQTDLSAAHEEYAPLSPSKEHRKIAGDIVDHLRRRHYLTINFDDELSEKVLYAYLDELDPGHSYFYDKDIKEFESEFQYALDEAFKKKNLDPGFVIYNRYQKRVIERLNYLISQIEAGLDTLNFEIDEILRTDRKDIPWPNSTAAMEELWRKRLKNNVLKLKLTDKPLDEIQKVLLRRYKNQLKRVLQNSNDDAFEYYINSLTLSIDPHTQYFSPHRTENFNINMSLSLEGIGAILQSEDEYTKIIRLIPGGPADRSNLLRAADRIIGVAQGSEGEMIDIIGWRLDEVVNKIRGPKGTLVRLEIIPADAADDHQTKVVRIVRDKVKLEEQAAKKEVITVTRGVGSYKIGIIDIPTFYADFKGMHSGNPNYKSTTKDVRKLIKELNEEGVKGIIIDLRNNGGGSLQEANSLTGLFIGLGPTVQVRNADSRIDIIRDHDPKLVYSGPIVVLVNRMSASASEIFAGAIQDYSRGIVLGGQTFGKGTVQSLFPLSKGQLKATTAKYYRVSGQSTQSKGVVPDMEYPSIFNLEDIGESSLPEALEWDKIRPIPYQKYYKMNSLIPILKEKHVFRSEPTQDYQYLLDRKARNKELRERKTVSLSEEKRKKELEEAEQWRLDLENALRTSKGKPLLEKLSDLDENEILGGHTSKINVEDPLLVEASEVLIDFIEALGKNLATL